MITYYVVFILVRAAANFVARISNVSVLFSVLSRD